MSPAYDMRALSLSLLTSAAFLLVCPNGEASLIYLYDFPGDSGLASVQTNSQPSNATFSDFTRNNVQSVSSGPADTFGSDHWSLSTSLDPTIFESFSITATGAGFHLNLSSLSFDLMRSATGPPNMEVGLFLNGSSTAYAIFDFSPTTSMATYTFNFTPLTDADNVTSASFKFYGWNAGGSGGQIYLDNVGTFGAISSVPEVAPFLPVSLIILCSVVQVHRRRARHPGVRSRRSRGWA